jgi:sulfatase maturation enzyme AslB (radical SAM superfamily)
LVSNGTNADTFFQELDSDFRFDYMDLSLEGTKEVDEEVRGSGHFETIERVLDHAHYKQHVDALYISTTMTAVNSSAKQLTEYFAWLVDHMDEPNLALLLLYPNHNVPESLALKSDDVERIVQMASSVSSRFNNVFLEVFPGSVPDLCELVEEGSLPGDDEVLRDEAGVLCGHIAENLMIRYITPHDLLKYHLRVSPEGIAMSSGGMEYSDYLKGNYGNLLTEDLSVVQRRITDELERERSKLPKVCGEMPCFRICRGSNIRCKVLQQRTEEVFNVPESCK